MPSQTMTAPSARAFYKERAPFTVKQAAYLSVTVLSALSVLYLLTVFATGNAWLPIGISAEPAELRLSLVECLLGLAALHVPALIGKVCRIKLPDALCVTFYAFVFCATVLGEMFSLYYAISFWDVILHSASGVMLGLLGVLLVTNFLKKRGCEKLTTPALVAVAAICFALCVGVVWEFYEFSVDSLFGLNMQKCLLEDGTALIGKAAVADTMKDLIMDFLGGTAAAVCSFVSVKRKQNERSAVKVGGLALGKLSVLPAKGGNEPQAA